MDERLVRFMSNHPLAGLSSPGRRQAFVRELFRSSRWLEILRRKKFKGSSNPFDSTFHPLLRIVESFDQGDRDEAVWLAFLCTHFGWHRPSETVRQFYARFGDGILDWKTVVQKPSGVRRFMIDNEHRLGQLKFGNHRKYETNKPRAETGTAAVIESFVDWVKRNGKGRPHAAFQAFVKRADSPTEAFETLFHAFSILRFGRTARFDLLCLLGNLGILNVRPAHPFLIGATGPKNGALLLITGKKEGHLRPSMIDLIYKLQMALGVPAECMEDALCNWQKKPGFLTLCSAPNGDQPEIIARKGPPCP